MSKKEFRDLSSAEISSRVYNARNGKPPQIKPLRGSSEDDNSSNLRIAPVSDDPQIVDQTSPRVSKETPRRDLSKLQNRLFLKLNSLLQRRIDRADRAQEIASLLTKIRRQSSVDVIIEKHSEHRFLIPLISSCDFFSRFEFLVEETLSFVLPLIRQEQNRQSLMDDILSSGALLFCFSSVRQFYSNPNIRTLGVELLSSSIDFILEISQDGRGSQLKDRKYASQNFVIHELVLHGGATFLPMVLNLFFESHSEIGIRRVLKCRLRLLRSSFTLS